MSILGGLGLVGVAAFLNASHAAEIGGWSSPTVIAIFVLAFGSTIGVPVIAQLWSQGRRTLTVLGILGLVCSESYGLRLSAERLLAVQAQRAQQTETEGGPWVQAREALDLSVQERKAECAGGLGQRCSKLRELEDAKRSALAKLPPPMSHTLIADATGLPPWLVDIGSAMAFSTGLMVLGFVLAGFGLHGSQEQTEPAQAVLEPVVLDEREQVVSWVREYRRRHGRSPKTREVQQAFGLPKTTAWRRLNDGR